MYDLEKIFDLRKIGDHEIGHLQWVLNSPSYDSCFKPYLVRMRHSLAAELLNPSGGRKDQYPDDFLRGGIVVIDGLLSLFEKLIIETEAERIARLTDPKTPAEEYEEARQAGKIRPGSGIQHPIPEYDPDEDF
jgi:hypothetical protein